MKHFIIQVWQNIKVTIVTYRQSHKIGFSIHVALLLISFLIITLYKVNLLNTTPYITTFLVVAAVLYQFVIGSYIYIKTTKIGKSIISLILLLTGIACAVLYIYCFKEILAPLSITFEEFCAFTAAASAFGAFITATNNANKAEKRAEKAESRYINDCNRNLFFKLLELHLKKSAAISYAQTNLFTGSEAFKKYVQLCNDLFSNYIFLEYISKLTQEKELYPENMDKASLIKFYKSYFDIPSNANYNLSLLKSRVQTMLESHTTQNFKYTIHNDLLLPVIGTLNLTEINKAIAYSFEILSDNFGHIIGHYFTNVYSILESIDNFETEKKFYMNLFCAQLSRYELTLLFYYAISKQGTQRVVELLLKYDLLNRFYYKDFIFINLGHLQKKAEKDKTDLTKKVLQGLLKERLNEYKS